ncbi:MAG: 2-oxoglutarate dehydrogenase E1 component [Chloroflexi bacterium]|nr:2-oxoglutarate dehydrogenase E1 component [Chloroflexota bacterium]
MNAWHDFPGTNAGYVLELYDRYRQNPSAVDAATREFFSHWTPPTDGAAPASTELPITKVVGAVNLAHAIRAFGHLAAQLDPLGSPPRGDPALNPATHGIAEDDLRQLPANLVGGPVADGAANALEAIQHLREVYSGTTGYDYDHIHIPKERDWLRQAAESGRFCPPQEPVDAVGLLDRLSQIEAFEHFLRRVFPGKTRFSLEGVDMMAPILDELVGAAVEAGTRSILIGMAHRGRLNVLAHILGKPYAQILAEFRDPARAHNFRESMGWTGDVKYHAGARRAIDGDLSKSVVITVPPNPSHVESADPLAQGMARAASESCDRAGPPRLNSSVALPILIHGDAAFPGQGIVAETLNYSRLEGYRTGGTIHIIANNQLGYTTEPQAGRSTLYASDLAKGFEIPIVHVNADDPEACIEAARLASGYRAEFHKDFLIDLIGYRRYGHNEGDEPTFTQPLMYQKIAQHPSVRALWSNALVARGLIDDDAAKAMRLKYMDELQSALESLQPERDLVEPVPEPPPPKAAQHVKTAAPIERLRELNAELLKLPDGFAPNPKLDRAMKRRRSALDHPDEASIDWAMAEQLAFAAILADGTPIRFTGEDVERGTFGHRHAVFHDVKTGATFTPLQAMPQAKAAFAVFDSPLSENAALGFEYGYNAQEPARLVIWEAQYGDFVNGAQMIIDEFIMSARAKWGQTPSLVLLLPHGFEGAGPDHSSGRLERFLELAAETNVRIANPTTAAQYFHLLRRQAALLKNDPLPLIVMTPKSLLRHPRAASPPRDLAEGRWQPVIDDDRARDQIKRLVFCSGKVYIDLVTSEHREKNPSVAIIRVEQLYPFPEAEIRAVLDEYQKIEEIVWLQEEPENMGAWAFVRPLLGELTGERVPLRYIGRPRNSSPAEGSLARHVANQKQLIEKAFESKT